MYIYRYEFLLFLFLEFSEILRSYNIYSIIKNDVLYLYSD